MNVEVTARQRPSLLMVALLIAASVLLVMRGPWRAMHGGGADFAAPYVAGLRFLRGIDPYSSQDFEHTWHASGAPEEQHENDSGIRPIYPPTTLLLMAPFSAMRWKWALASYELLCMVLYVFLLIQLSDEAGLGWKSWKRTGFLVYALVLAPIHTGLGLGNISIVAFLLATWCLLLGRAEKDVASGFALAASLCLKPSVGVCVLIYWLVCRRWKITGWSLGLSGLVSGLAMARMAGFPRVWLDDYRANTTFLFGPNGVANFTNANPDRFDLLNLQVPFFQLTHDTRWANALAWVIFAVLVCIWFRSILKRQVKDSWCWPGVLLLLGLLPIYQRNYNAGFVLLAVLWSMGRLQTRTAKAILLLAGILVLPGEGLLRHLGGLLPSHGVAGFLMDFVVLPQATWAVLGISLLLLYAMVQDTKGLDKVPS